VGQHRLLDDVAELQVADAEGDWTDLPAWVRYYLELGSFLGKRSIGSVRLRTLLLVPVAQYVPGLISLSILLERFLANPWLSEDVEAHANLLRELPEGTSVTIRSGHKVFPGIYKGRAIKDSGECFGVQIQSRHAGGLTKWTPLQRVLEIKPAPGWTQKLPANPEGKRVRSTGSLIHQFIGPAAYSYLLAKRIDLTLIGVREKLRRDFSELTFRKAGDVASVQELARVREFGGTDGYFVSGWCSAGVKGDTSESTVAVFSRAGDFLKARPHWSKNHLVVVLEASDDRVDEAVQQFTDDFREDSGQTLSIELATPALIGTRLWAYEVPAE
jgi:hypothetical protein